MLGFILYLMVIGFVAGFIARAVVPGKDALSIPGTILLGIIGSFVGGFIGYVLTHHDSSDGAFQASGIIGSIVGAIVALLVYRAVTGRGRRHVMR
ncbi:MAG: GlsB/YeaQ/YmgE family stress response membrane protein [Ilumatobacteraceae bacterium]